ncbi:SDR family oxidoreductase [Alteromonas sp. a30]|uniref:SDR family oxidoreductase n=1 Tax=Alteromonas sp. a30 TaxID=2730917 RepID=UPI002280593E|nr:SDR family oxidoreductase [Alteromonas sp. a30]MCY7296639.1 SDR family oxidoreductase [Alteromonas sp. a30]
MKGKTVLLTGGAGGLGQALVMKLLEAGANVAIFDMSTSSIKADNLLSIKVDITQPDALQVAFTQVISCFGNIDILINNAGITHMSRFADTEQTTFDKIMAVNFTASVNITRLCLPYLQKSQGQIVAISSVAGFAPLYGRSAYSASKHAMEGFFLSLASELEDNHVHVFIVAPSFVKSRPELTAQVNAGVSSPGAMKKSTNGQQISPDQAAQLILRGIENKQHYLRLGRVAKLAYWLNTLFPSIYRRVMKSSAKKEFL